jgi:hypothetical protein
VDPEREDRGLQRTHRNLSFGQHADERGRQGSVLRDDDVLGRGPVGQLLLAVVVEDDLVDRRIERELLELAESACVDGFDDDQTPNRIELEPRGVDDESNSSACRR